MSQAKEHLPPRRHVHHFAEMKRTGTKITSITAYDYPTGLVAEAAGVDIVLVGDSLGMVALGFDTTIPVTLDNMVHHTAAVRRAVKNSFLVADLPFLTYHGSLELTVKNAGRLVQESGAEAIKMEGGTAIADDIRAVTAAGIPVMGHIGLQPQSVHKLGGFRVQGKDKTSAERLMEDALAVQEAGAFAIVLEAMDTDLAREVTEKLAIPTIGIGAGRQCDGQVQVITDLAGIIPGKSPRLARRYAETGVTMNEAVAQFCDDVRTGSFPEEKHEY